eukprot:366498-Chlamydomonas_euryale.AAC.13
MMRRTEGEERGEESRGCESKRLEMAHRQNRDSLVCACLRVLGLLYDREGQVWVVTHALAMCGGVEPHCRHLKCCTLLACTSACITRVCVSGRAQDGIDFFWAARSGTFTFSKLGVYDAVCVPLSRNSRQPPQGDSCKTALTP